ncbi:hypothetical protein Sjap_018553 [Stephania japonica]|uniref:Uncharacterized protein n=1 Tax=Stephania japonica TaxID=461633 RepID=A0AAP0I8E9_9MAGN
MHSPVPLKLGKIGLMGLLVGHMKIVLSQALHLASPDPELDRAHPLGGDAESELVAPALVLEAVDAPERLRDCHVADEVGQGEEADGGPAVPALEARGEGLGREQDGQGHEEELVVVEELLLLEVHRPLLL